MKKNWTEEGTEILGLCPSKYGQRKNINLDREKDRAFSWFSFAEARRTGGGNSFFFGAGRTANRRCAAANQSVFGGGEPFHVSFPQ